jgi:general secretion pathway protein D
MSSARPVSEEDLLPILETVLRMNGAALMRDGDNYTVVPEASAVSGRGDVGEARPGYGISILPLRYTSAQTLVSLIDGFGTRPGSVRAETARNLLLVLGNSADREAAIETAMSFDADWMQDQTVAILPLQNAKPETVIQELQRIFKSGEGGLGAELVQFIPMSRLRAVLVVSPQKDIIARARTWVQRLDSENPDLEADVYVYRVKYREARKLATLLTQLFSSGPATGDAPADQIEPGADAVTTEGGGLGDGFTEETPGAEGEPGGSPSNPVLVGSEPANAAPAGGTGPRIQADISNNSIVIYADLETRQRVLSALSSLDVPQIQVAINVTMAEIQLTEDLEYGVQFFLQNKRVGSLGFFGAAAQSISRTTPGFNLLLGSNTSPELIINAFDRITNVQVLSSPSLVVVENEIARFQVGDQIPIVTRTVTDTSSDDLANTSNEVEYRDTGIILSVKPRVSDNGLVAMTIEQEISSVSAGGNSLTPTISNRKVASSISVADGQTVLLGGLISEQNGSTRAGLPGLNRTKGLRNLLGNTSKVARRTELIILIKPTVIYEAQDAQHVAEELRSKMYTLGASQSR